jgi:hypothetical protein
VNATTGAEWVQMVSLSVGLYAAVSAPYFLLVEAEVWSWPRPVTAAVDRVKPVVWSTTRSAPVYPLLREWDNARHTVREAASEARLYALLSLREACLTAAALYALLTITPGDAR